MHASMTYLSCLDMITTLAIIAGLDLGLPTPMWQLTVIKVRIRGLPRSLIHVVPIIWNLNLLIHSQYLLGLDGSES